MTFCITRVSDVYW